MFRTTARRFAAAVAAVAAVAVVLVVLSGTVASAAPDHYPHRTLYHNFCPLTKADVAAAGPYSPSTHSEPTSIRP